jgi:hypothetical protein
MDHERRTVRVFLGLNKRFRVTTSPMRSVVAVGLGAAGGFGGAAGGGVAADRLAWTFTCRKSATVGTSA